MPILQVVMPIIRLTHPTRSVGSATPSPRCLGDMRRLELGSYISKLYGHLGLMSGGIYPRQLLVDLPRALISMVPKQQGTRS